MIALSPKQHACVALVARGLDNGEIADELGIALQTVKVHLTAARNKTGSRNRVELAVAFVRGEIKPPALQKVA